MLLSVKHWPNMWNVRDSIPSTTKLKTLNELISNQEIVLGKPTKKLGLLRKYPPYESKADLNPQELDVTVSSGVTSHAGEVRYATSSNDRRWERQAWCQIYWNV